MDNILNQIKLKGLFCVCVSAFLKPKISTVLNMLLEKLDWKV